MLYMLYSVYIILQIEYLLSQRLESRNISEFELLFIFLKSLYMNNEVSRVYDPRTSTNLTGVSYTPSLKAPLGNIFSNLRMKQNILTLNHQRSDMQLSICGQTRQRSQGYVFGTFQT